MWLTNAIAAGIAVLASGFHFFAAIYWVRSSSGATASVAASLASAVIMGLLAVRAVRSGRFGRSACIAGGLVSLAAALVYGV